MDKLAVERNLQAYGVFAASEQLLMELVKAGANRQVMHDIIREHSMLAWVAVTAGRPNPLATSLSQDDRVTSYLPAEQVRAVLQTSNYVGDAPERARQLADRVRQLAKVLRASGAA